MSARRISLASVFPTNALLPLPLLFSLSGNQSEARLPSCKFYFGLVSMLGMDAVGVGVSAAVEKIGVDIGIYRARTDTAMDNGHRSVH